MKRYLLMAILVAAVSFGGCTQESKLPVATGKASLRAVNAIRSSPDFTFLIEERAIGQAEYKSATAPAQYDDLEYTFHFEAALAGETTQSRVASQFLDVVKDKDYTFIISGIITAPTITIWEADRREWAGTETTFEARFAHTNASLGAVDVYFADAAIPPVLGSAIGTIATGDISAPADYEEGAYVLSIYPAGQDPADIASTILFQGDPVALGPQNQLIISVFDGDENDLSPLAVRMFNQISSVTGAIIDSLYAPTARFFHTNAAVGPVDIYVDDPLTVPLLAGHAFGDVTADIEMTPGDLPLTYTAADNIGSILIDIDESVFRGTRAHAYLIRNSAGEDSVIGHFPDRRSISTYARMSLLNSVSTQDSLDIYILPTGGLIDDATPFLGGIPVGSIPVQFPLLENIYDIHITLAGEKTILAGPIVLDVQAGDVLETIIYENVSPDAVDLVFIPAP